MEQMTFLYTARGIFDKTYNRDGRTWDSYIKWSKLTHLTEVVSLDLILNELLVEPDYDNPDDWNFIQTDGQWQTNLFTTEEYVLQRTKTKQKFNLLTVIVNPNHDCKDILLTDYEFMGYELLDWGYGNSALTNCGGFDEIFLPSDLNSVGLIEDYLAAYDIRKRLLENNPEEHHANTNI